MDTDDDSRALVRLASYTDSDNSETNSSDDDQSTKSKSKAEASLATRVQRPNPYDIFLESARDLDANTREGRLQSLYENHEIKKAMLEQFREDFAKKWPDVLCAEMFKTKPHTALLDHLDRTGRAINAWFEDPERMNNGPPTEFLTVYDALLQIQKPAWPLVDITRRDIPLAEGFEPTEAELNTAYESSRWWAAIRTVAGPIISRDLGEKVYRIITKPWTENHRIHQSNGCLNQYWDPYERVERYRRGGVRPDLSVWIAVLVVGRGKMYARGFENYPAAWKFWASFLFFLEFKILMVHPRAWDEDNLETLIHGKWSSLWGIMQETPSQAPAR